MSDDRAPINQQQSPSQAPRLVSRSVGLVAENLGKRFKKRPVLRGVNISVQRGEVVGLLGPNGAGKTTSFYIITGLITADYGTISLDGEDITGLKPHELCARGMLRTFQIAQEFTTLTVRENLMMVPCDQSGESLLDSWLRPKLVRSEEERVRAKADEVIEFLEITQVADELAGNLSGGQKKLLELGRTMMVDAKVVRFEAMKCGEAVAGPAIVESSFTTVVVDPGASAARRDTGSLVIEPGN